MFTITWDFKGFSGNRLSFEDREEANAVWQLLKESGATNMRAESDPPKQMKKHVVRCVFPGGSKPYTYLCKEKVEVGANVVVWTSDGRQIVKVIDSGMMSDQELAKICPLSRFRYIEGKVVSA